MTKTVTLDVRDQAPPEPLIRAMEKLATMASGECLKLMIHREPIGLYRHLQEMRVPWEVEECDPDWVIRIGPLR